MSRPDDDSSPEGKPSQEVRRTFLWRFENPEDAAAVARVLAMLEEALNEGGQWGPDKNRLHAGQVGAAGEDLLLIADYLDEVAESRELNHLSIDEWRICDQAATSAEEVRRIGTTLIKRTRREPPE